MPGELMPGAAVVEAARAGDAQALDSLVGAYLPLVYNIVGRALDFPAEIDDVVQDVMLQMVRDLRQLRDPGAFRSWLVAITMRQVRGHWRARRSAPAAFPLEDAELADPGADFVDLTIVTLGLSDQRREVAQASRWLDGEDRHLLALWWLEAAGQLNRTELAAAMESEPAQVAVLVHRTKARLDAARTVVRAVQAAPRCGTLDTICANWDGRPSPLWRKRIARHVRECPSCSLVQLDLVPAEGLLVGMGLVAVPAVLLAATYGHIGIGGAGGLGGVSGIGRASRATRVGRASRAGRVGGKGAARVNAGHRAVGRRGLTHRIALHAGGKAAITGVTVLAVVAGVIGVKYTDRRPPSSPTVVAVSSRATPPTTRASTATAPATASPTASAPAAAAIVNTAFPIRSAFYYPWYPENFAPGDTHYTPSAGDYSVDDPATVDRQIEDMQYAGLQAGIISWWGVGLREDERTPLLMAEAAKLGFSWSAYYEKEGYGNPSSAEILSDLLYLRKYSSQTAWLHIDGLPVIFVFADGSDGCGMVSRWAQANQTAHYYVVLKVFPGYLSCPDQPQGWHQYADGPDIQPGYSAIASPGFWKYDQAAPSMPRDPAEFRQQVTAAAESKAPFQLIISYNEWGEGTAVESATAWSSPSGHGVYMDILHQVFDAYPR
jgi:RNA polymerase sigma factor (sigma-70 family)